MKKILSIVLIMIMAFAVIGSAAARPDRQRSFSADALEDAQVIAFIPSGEGDDAIGFFEDEEESVGPESFAVNSGNVYILDSVKNRIIAIENGETRYIPICGIDHPAKFTIAEDRFYVIDESIKVFDIFGNSYCTLPYPEKVDESDVYRIYNNDGELCFLTHSLECYRLDPSSNKWTKDYTIGVDGRFEQIETLSLPNAKVDLDVGPTCLVQYHQHSENELLVGVYEFVPYLPVIETEYTVRRYDMQGQLLGCTVVNNLEAYSLPNTVVNVDPYTGIVYTMLCREEGVYVTKPTFRMEYQSHMDELTEIAENILESDGKNTPMRYSTVTSKTRAEVKTRAEAAMNHVWTVTARNKQGGTHITVPQYVLNTNNGKTTTGIPYCWGGYFLELTTVNGDGFDDIISNSTGGNTYHYYHHGQVAGTAGLDCSGFVSYAYCISRHNTEDFTSYGHYIYGNQGDSTIPNCSSFENLEYMDFLVKYSSDPNATDNHIILCYGTDYDTSLTSIECTTLTLGATDLEARVKTRNLSISNLNGYRLRTPYACGGTEPCVPGGNYYTNSNKHWQHCIHCGENCPKHDHSWSDYISNPTNHWKQCIVCERHDSEAAHTWSSYMHNGQQHWQECTVCGRIRNLADHSWIAYQNGYRCKICFLYVDQYPADKACDSIIETELY